MRYSDELWQEGVEQAWPTIGGVSITSLLLAMAGLLLKTLDSWLQFQYRPQQHCREAVVSV